jgi:hypothetical protein
MTNEDKNEIINILIKIIEDYKEKNNPSEIINGLENNSKLKDLIYKQNELKKYIDKKQLLKFIILRIVVKINSIGKGEIDNNQLANSILEELNNIPYEYNFFFELPLEIPEEIQDFIKISKKISLGKIKYFNNSILKDNSKNYLIRRLSNPNENIEPVNEKGIYLNINTQGFMYIEDINSSIFQEVYSKLKVFIYLAKIDGILEERKWNSKKLNLNLICQDSKSEISYLNFPEGLAQLLSGLEISKDIFSEKPKLLSFSESYDKELNQSAKKIKSFEDRIKIISNYLDYDENNDDIKRINTAIEWAFDSLINVNETFSFIKTCIGIEAIISFDLSDKNNNNKKPDHNTNDIKQRVSYMLGKNNQQRIDLADKIHKIFQKRNILVHGKESKLKNEDSNLLLEAQNLLQTIIQHEVNIFLKSK